MNEIDDTIIINNIKTKKTKIDVIGFSYVDLPLVGEFFRTVFCQLM